MKHRFMSFDEWCRENEDLREELANGMAENSGVKCPECDGWGETECGECGQDKSCERCDGDGKLKDPSAFDVTNEMRALYNAQKAIEEKKWKDWHDAMQSVA